MTTCCPGRCGSGCLVPQAWVLALICLGQGLLGDSVVACATSATALVPGASGHLQRGRPDVNCLVSAFTLTACQNVK